MAGEEQHIHKLSELTIAQIAAGEAIESPAGALKELLENSLDAGAKKIEVNIEGSGFEKILVRDDGEGITREDLPLALDSFATSKITKAEDIIGVTTLGFRGEALGSIRSVSSVIVESRRQNAEKAWSISGRGAEIDSVIPSSLPRGTQVIVRDLFFNAPVRREFTGREKTLRKKISDVIVQTALAHPDISLVAHVDSVEFTFPKCDTLIDRIAQVYNRELADSLIPVYKKDGDRALRGYISSFNTYRTNGSDIRLFVAQRPVEWKRIVSLLRNVYGELMPPGRFPFALLFLDGVNSEVDVNVHPQKREIRFKDEEKMVSFLESGLRKTVESSGPIPMRNLAGPRNPFLKPVPGEPPRSTPRIQDEKFEFVAPFLVQDFPAAEEETGHEEKALHVPTQIHAKLFDTFILASSEEGLFLIDQHTAHERINYERFIDSLGEKSQLRQKLVSPVALHLDIGEQKLLSEYSNLLEEIGFELEDMGPAGLSIESVPFYVPSGLEEIAFRRCISIAEKRDSVNAATLFDQLAKDLACSASIKKGDPESLETLRELIDQLAQCRVPTRCPHGRPTMVFLGREEIFSLFKRRAD